MRTDKEILHDLRSIENSLSPENLHMDGEASKVYVRKRYKQLISQRSKLIKELAIATNQEYLHFPRSSNTE